MKTEKARWSHLYRDRLPGVWTPLLGAASVLYGVGVRCRLWAYGSVFLAKQSLPGLVVSVGNITVGGTGKTPAVAMLAGWAKEEGYEVAVLSRGYGGLYKTDVVEVSDGSDVKAGARECGDEPYLLATKLRGVPVIVSRDRYTAGMWAHERFGCNLFILDDGFQHVTLKRDLDMVLVDSNDGFGNGHLLPLGPLREPLSQLARGDAFVVTRWQNSPAGQNLVDYLESQFPDKPVFRGAHIPEKVVFPFVPAERTPQFLKEKRVLAFAGIARPMALRETLTRLGAHVVHSKGFRDHHPFTRGDFENLITAKEKAGAEYLITTEKDWVRLAPLALGRSDTGFMAVRFEWVEGMDRFLEMFRKRLDPIIRST